MHYSLTKKLMMAILSTALLSGSLPLFASNQIQLLGHFGSDKALVRINGQQRILKVNQISPEGVRLLGVDAHRATIIDQGQQRVIRYDGQIQTNYTAPTKRDVQIVANNNGSFTTNGSINGQVVKFLVDTGATTIAMNEQTAKRLGIDFRYNGQPVQATTASGVIPAYGVHLNSVSIGAIEQKNVKAVVLEGEYPVQVLLGMSFLDKVHLERKDNLMMLREKY